MSRRYLELVHQFDPSERIIGLVTFRDAVIVATDRAVYRLPTPTSKLEPIKPRKKP